MYATVINERFKEYLPCFTKTLTDMKKPWEKEKKTGMCEVFYDSEQCQIVCLSPLE